VQEKLGFKARRSYGDIVVLNVLIGLEKWCFRTKLADEIDFLFC
jgi:hypothetical protein